MPRGCRRIGVAEDGRPFCIHGPMINDGKWFRCGVSSRAKYKRSYERLKHDPMRLAKHRANQRVVDWRLAIEQGEAQLEEKGL